MNPLKGIATMMKASGENVRYIEMKAKTQQSLPSKGKHKNAPGLPAKAPALHAQGVARAPHMDTTSPETKK